MKAAARIARLAFRPALLRAVFMASAALVLLLALLPPSEALPTTGWDKANHVLAFAWLAWWGVQGWPRRTAALWTGLLAYGVLIELLQSLTPTRSAEWGDLLADAAGLALGLGLGRIALLAVRRRLHAMLE